MNTEHTPFVSVVIPAFNASRTIGECLDALSTQSISRDRYELIVVDDGSTDDTVRIAREHDAVVVEQLHAGPAIARNLGVSHASGVIILFTDSDCIASSDFIEQMTRPFNDPNIVGVKGAYRTHQRELWARFAQVEFEERYVKLARSASIDFVDSHAAAFRKQVFLEVGGFDPHFPVANNEDVDLSYKIARIGYKMVFNPHAIIYHYHPSEMRTYLRIKFFRAYWRMLVYRRFPEKILSDSYTPQTMKLQIVTLALCLLSVLGILVSSLFVPITAYLAGLFFITTTPFLVRTLKSDPGLIGFAFFALILRSLAFGFGILGGFLSQRKRDWLIPSLLLLSDLIAALMAYIGGYWLRDYLLTGVLGPMDHSIELYLSLFPLVLVFWIMTFHAGGLYRATLHVAEIGEFALVTRSISLTVFIIITVSFFWKWDYSRSFILTFWILSIIFANLVRRFVRGLQRQMKRRGYQILRTLIVGSGETGRILVRQLRKHENKGIQIVGLVDDAAPCSDDSFWAGTPYLGVTNELESVIREHSVDDVYIAKPDLPHQFILDLIVKTEKTGAGFKIVSDVMSIVTGGAALSEISGLPVVDLKEEGRNAGRRLVKRIMDIVLGFLFLVLISPIMLLAAIAIHLTIPGSILVEEERVGRNGRLFKMLRFRTSPATRDTRTTEPDSVLGRLFQKTNLDEIPQLINVIRGEMSLVGPRPEVPEIVATYAAWQQKRLEVLPGSTGLWQISTPGNRPLHEDLEYDFYYIKNYNIWMDLSLILQTIPILITGKGTPGE